MLRSAVLLLVSSIVVSAPGFADTRESTELSPSSALPPAVLPLAIGTLPQLDAKSWQEEHDAARSKKSRGRILTLIGAGVTGLGVLLIVKESGDRSCGFGFCYVEYDYRVPALVTSSGAGLLVWGIMQERDASRTLRELERQRPARTRAETAIVIARGTSVAVGNGGVALRHVVSW